MVGGGGEKKTLRLVAQYADACNVFGNPEGIARKYEILRAHCEAVGRDPDEIERSTLQNIDPILPGGGGRESVERIVERFGDLADAGAQHIIIGHARRGRSAPAGAHRAGHPAGRPRPVSRGRPGRRHGPGRIPPRGIQSVVGSRS